MEELALRVQKTARVLRLKPENYPAKVQVLLLHGYGQSAEDMLNPFHSIISDAFCYLVPEGLNAFYPKGLGGKTGNSWMTSKFRLAEIQDYLGYLNQVIQLDAEFSGKRVWIGFSQGVTTMFRLLKQCAPQNFPDMVIPIAGGLPAEWEGKWPQELSKPILTGFCGDEDGLVRLDDFQEGLEALKVNASCFSFKGKHEVNAHLAQLIHQEINKKLRLF